MKLMKEKAEQLLQRCEVVVITSVNEEGYPRPVPMSQNQIGRIFRGLDGNRQRLSENERFPSESQSRLML